MRHERQNEAGTVSPASAASAGYEPVQLRRRSPHVSKEDADLLAEMDFLVEAYAASDEPMTDKAVQLATTVRHYVRRWAVLCGYIGDGS